jgi:IclR family transcriptional regulator, pca regulon regulatory protein
MPKPPEERDFVRALTRGLDVILAFSQHRPRMTLSEVAEATSLSRPTARRLLLTLQEGGYVRTDGKTFTLTPRVLALGYAYLGSLNLTEIAQRHMEHVVERTGEGCSLSVLDETEVVYVTRVPTHRITSLTLTTGTRLPAHATSMGQVLLADLTEAQLVGYFQRAELRRLTARTICSQPALQARLAEVRQQGWALVDQELEDGLRSISAPVRDSGGRVIAALGLSATTISTDLTQVREVYLPLLMSAAAVISSELGAGQGAHGRG